MWWQYLVSFVIVAFASIFLYHFFFSLSLFTVKLNGYILKWLIHFEASYFTVKENSDKITLDIYIDAFIEFVNKNTNIFLKALTPYRIHRYSSFALKGKLMLFKKLKYIEINENATSFKNYISVTNEGSKMVESRGIRFKENIVRIILLFVGGALGTVVSELIKVIWS